MTLESLRQQNLLSEASGLKDKVEKRTTQKNLTRNTHKQGGK